MVAFVTLHAYLVLSDGTTLQGRGFGTPARSVVMLRSLATKHLLARSRFFAAPFGRLRASSE